MSKEFFDCKCCPNFIHTEQLVQAVGHYCKQYKEPLYERGQYPIVPPLQECVYRASKGE